MREDAILSPSQVGQYLKSMMDRDHLLSRLLVRGELSNYKMYPSGHHYFTLKDGEGALRCVMFRREAQVQVEPRPPLPAVVHKLRQRPPGVPANTEHVGVEVALPLLVLKGDDALRLPIHLKQQDILPRALQGLSGSVDEILFGFHAVVVDGVARPGGIQGQLVGKPNVPVKFRFL